MQLFILFFFIYCYTNHMNILMIDNYDSFTYNLVQFLSMLNTNVKVIRNNDTSYKELLGWADKIVISPGPKTPSDAGFSKKLIISCKGKIPILGVCLGMQALNEVYGGVTDYAPCPVHGKISRIYNKQKGLFQGLPNSFFVARYHSLMTRVSTELIIDAWTSDNVPMAISDPKNHVYGIQFHPESFLSEYGIELLYRFVNIVN